MIKYLPMYMVVLLLLASCAGGFESDPYEPVIYYTDSPKQDPQVAARTWWQNILHPIGTVQGQLRFPDQRPVANAYLDCQRFGQFGRTTEGTPRSEDGTYTCGGKPGLYSLTVYHEEIAGGQWSTLVEVLLGQVQSDIIVPNK